MVSFEGSTQTYLVRLDRGEEIIESLASFARKKELGSGWISGIGAVHSTELGYFELETRTYHRRKVDQELELTNLTGNITWSEGAPVIHAHATLSGPDYTALGGHLFAATIAVTGEFQIIAMPSEVQRSVDDVSGLKLISGGAPLE